MMIKPQIGACATLIHYFIYSSLSVNLIFFQIKANTRHASQVQQPEEEGGRGRWQAAQEDQAAGERWQVRFSEESGDAGETNKKFFLPLTITHLCPRAG